MTELKDTALAKFIVAIFEGIMASAILVAMMPINSGTFILGIVIIVSEVYVAIKTAKEGDFKLLVTMLIVNSVGSSSNKN